MLYAKLSIDLLSSVSNTILYTRSDESPDYTTQMYIDAGVRKGRTHKCPLFLLALSALCTSDGDGSAPFSYMRVSAYAG